MGATIVVLARGFYGRLGVAPETLEMLEAREIPVHVARTEEAAGLYDSLRETERVGALIHSTC